MADRDETMELEMRNTKWALHLQTRREISSSEKGGFVCDKSIIIKSLMRENLSET